MRSLTRMALSAAIATAAILAACSGVDRLSAPVVQTGGPHLTSTPYCPEASCTSLGGAYISHFTGASCTGTESYYTPYFFYDGVRRSWDGGGYAGTTLRTVTNRSYKDSSGTCYNAWPGGNTLSDFVTIYR
jgi:hypothetical protein